MPRKTIYLPGSVDELVREAAREGESYSSTVARLLEAGARTLGERRAPSYVGSGEGPEDLGRMAERYLRELAEAR